MSERHEVLKMVCDTCDHRRNPQGGHCYMFKFKPDDGVCGLHNMTRRASARSRLIGENMQVLVASGVPLVRALDAALKALDH